MRNTAGLLDIIRRSLTGPVVSEAEFDSRHVAQGIARVVKAYEIRVDRSHVVNQNDDLADRVWDAAIEFLANCGVYCQSTGRVILHSQEEIKAALRQAPSQVWLGTGTDIRLERFRRVEDPRPPLNMGSPIGAPISEELFVPAMVSYIQEPIVDVTCAPTLLTVYGQEIRTASPLEILAAWHEEDLMALALKRAGRPGMAVTGVSMSVSDIGHLSAASRGGHRPTDMYTFGIVSELKTNFEILNKLAHSIRQDGIIDPYANPIYGGLGGGVEGQAVLLTASMIALSVVFLATCNGSSPTHPFHFNDTGREIMTATSLAFQAIARNSHLMTNLTVSPVGGPGTDTLLYECVAFTLMSTVSGASRILGPRSATGVVPAHFSGLEARFNGQVAHAATKVGRGQADEIVQRALAQYEALQDKKPFGQPFPEVYDVDTVQPKKEWLAIYERVEKEVTDWGLPLQQIALEQF